MTGKKSKFIIPLITMGTYLIMVVVNALANILPINGRGTGEISDAYANLFAPAGLTFAIWGVIYILLFAFATYFLIRYSKESDQLQALLSRIGVIFSISSVINTVWIFAWHYEVIWLSLICMIGILMSLIKINLLLRKEKFTSVKHILIRLPFTVYLGWITVATIANVTTFLVSINWNRFNISEVVWTDSILLIGAIIGFVCTLYYKSYAYSIVLIWAYVGIVIKHVSSNTFDGMYPSVIVTTIVSLVIILASLILLLRKSLSMKKA